MKRETIKMGQELQARSDVAQTMWGRYRSGAFRDRRKALPRKAKHKARLEDWQ